MENDEENNEAYVSCHSLSLFNSRGDVSYYTYLIFVTAVDKTRVKDAATRV